MHNVHRGGGFGGWKKDESHFPFDSDRVFHLPDLSGTFPSHTVFKLLCHSRLQSFHHWLPGNPDQKTDSLLIYWGWQSSPCVSPYCWCCCWWHWMKAVSMASAIIHWDVIIMFFVILSCKMLFSLKCLILSFKGSNKYCCTRYQQNPVSVKRLKSYTVQDDNCKLKAIM